RFPRRQRRTRARTFLRRGRAGREGRWQLSGLHAPGISQQPRGELLRSQPRLPLRQRFMKATLLLLIPVATLMIAAGLAAGSDPKPARLACCAKTTADEAPIARPLTDQSLYQLDAIWTNDDGRTFELASLRGRPQIVVMFFANCQYACPLLVYQLKQIEAALPEAVRANVGFTLVSFDSERDTPAALKSYRGQHELGSNWTLLRSGPEDVRGLAALLGVKFNRDAQGQFLHSNIITLLNSEGEIAFQQSGLAADRKEMICRVTSLMER